MREKREGLGEKAGEFYKSGPYSFILFIASSLPIFNIVGICSFLRKS